MQLVDLFQFYMMFPIDDHTGDPVSDEDVTAAHYEKVQQVRNSTASAHRHVRQFHILKRKPAFSPEHLQQICVSSCRIASDCVSTVVTTSRLNLAAFDPCHSRAGRLFARLLQRLPLLANKIYL